MLKLTWNEFFYQTFYLISANETFRLRENSTQDSINQNIFDNSRRLFLKSIGSSQRPIAVVKATVTLIKISQDDFSRN